MKSVHLVVADLFLPKEFAAEVCAGLQLPALEKMLARAASSLVGNPAQIAPLSLESMLCELFGVASKSDAPVADISAAFDGLAPGCWLRADPVHMRLQREQVVLLPNVTVSNDEALIFCASLNEHFAGEGLEFFAPHPQRWYLRLAEAPDMVTVPLSQAAGRNIHGNLPTGADAGRWRRIFNEIQMLLFAHPLNVAREARGELTVNSVWLWGNGKKFEPAQCAYASASSDEVLVEMLAEGAGLPFTQWQRAWRGDAGLLVWTGLRTALQRGDLAAWRTALQDFETGYAQPLWQALRRGEISQLKLDVLGGDSRREFRLTRVDAFAFWRRPMRLADYSVESTQNE